MPRKPVGVDTTCQSPLSVALTDTTTRGPVLITGIARPHQKGGRERATPGGKRAPGFTPRGATKFFVRHFLTSLAGRVSLLR